MAELMLFCYSAAVKRNNDWYGYSGYVFARDREMAVQFIEQRFKNGVVRMPFNTNIAPGDEVRIVTIERVTIGEGTFL